MTPQLIVAPVLVPLLAACTAVLAPRLARPVAVAAVLVTAGLSAAVAVDVARVGVRRLVLGDWPIPLGLQLRADGLAAVFLLLTATVGVALTTYAAADPRTQGDPYAAPTPPRQPDTPGAGPRGPFRAVGEPGFWPTWLLLLGGLNAAFLAGDLFNAYVALEVVGLAAVGLVALGGGKAWRPALNYLMVAVAGSLLFLAAVALTYAATGTLDMAEAGRRLLGEGPAAPGGLDPAVRRVVLVLGLTGLALKSALVPLHGWLPAAHGSAPAAVSPALSALVVKAAYVVALRLWFEVAGPDAGVAAAAGVAATLAVLWGGLQALRQEGFKRIVAYSTVAQVGYLYLVFPLTTAALGAGRPDLARAAWTGAILMALAHGLAKAALFMAAGLVLLGVGSDRLVDLAGHARQLPMIGLTAGLAAVSLAGLPISAGFLGKWQIATAAVAGGTWWLIVLLAAGALLAGAYLLRPVAALLREPEQPKQPQQPDSASRPASNTVGRLPQLAALAPALLVVLLGLNAAALATLSLVGSPLALPGTWGAVLP